MSASPTDIQGLLQQAGLLSDASPGMGGLFGPYGGSSNLGLSLLANSGPSPYPHSFGQLVGQSALQAQQIAQSTQQNALQRQLMAMQLAQGMASFKARQEATKGLQDADAQAQAPEPADQPSPAPPPLIRSPDYQPPQAAAPAQPGLPGYLTPKQIDAYAAYALQKPDADPLAVLGKRQEMIQKNAQLSAAQQITPLENVVKSASPITIVSADPKLMEQWRTSASGFGLDPDKDFNARNVRSVFAMQANNIRARAGIPFETPPEQLETIPTGVGGSYQRDPVTGKISGGAPTQETAQFVTPSGVRLMPKAEGIAQGLTPYNPATFINQGAIDSQAHAIATYRQAPPGAFVLKSAQGQELMRAVYAENPQWDATQYQQKQKARNAFATGKQGDITRSLSVATDHLDQLKAAAAAMNNGDVQGVNRVVNWFKTQGGLPAVTNFNSMKEIVGDEVTKAVIGSGAGSAGDREAIKAAFAAKSSPAQILGTIDKYKGLMGGQLSGLRRQYTKSTGLNDFDEMVSDTAKGELGAASGTSSAHPPAIQSLLDKYK